MLYDNDNDEQRQKHITFVQRDCVFLLTIYIENIQLSTLATTVIKLNHSVIIFPGK